MSDEEIKFDDGVLIYKVKDSVIKEEVTIMQKYVERLNELVIEEKNELYIRELLNRTDKAVKEIKKELEENHHLSYGVALAIINILEGDK